jgi:hypothetical protein
MRARVLLLLLAAVVLVVVATLSELARAQQQGAPSDGLQPSVPAGRGPGGLAPPGGTSRGGPPPGPAPRSATGRVLLGGATPDVKGVWLPDGGAGVSMADPSVIPFQPWAQAVLANRAKFQLEPHTRCKPSGGPRVFLTPYGVEIVEFPELQRILIFDVGGPHSFRTIYMDGRAHPNYLEPTYYGHSVGRWEGDTLVVDTVGFNERFWFDRSGLPHTNQLRTLERFTRIDLDAMRYELTIDDPGAYTAPFTGRLELLSEPGTELFEYVCQQSNFADELMVGEGTSVDRRSPIVP